MSEQTPPLKPPMIILDRLALIVLGFIVGFFVGCLVTQIKYDMAHKADMEQHFNMSFSK